VRNLRRFLQVLVDGSVLSIALLLAYLLRYDFDPPFQVMKHIALQLPYIVALEYGLILSFGAHRVIWQFVSAADLLLLVRPLIFSSAILGALRTTSVHYSFAHKDYLFIPWGVIAMNLALSTLLVLGVRLVRRLVVEDQARRKIRSPRSTKRLLIVGAGPSGVQVAKEIQRRPDLGYTLVGFIDDDPAKLRTIIASVPVKGNLDHLDDLITDLRVEGLIIALAEAAGSTIRRVVATAKDRGLETKIVPGLHEIIGGNVSISRLRDVEIEDLLGRDAVQLDSEGVSSFVRRKVVAVTGAGGSIGSELSRQLAGFGPSRLLLIERAEPALFEIHRELSAAYPTLHIEPCLADITVPERMRSVLTTYGCDAIFHAAAHKHVPMIEWNPSEAIRNNVLGTKGLADLAADLGVGHFVLISTDKAINPTSVMGASKRVAELYVQAMGRSNRGTSFVSVRFGNVLGSAGSVVPIFKRQIAEGGPVTVTHPDMQRYFMTIPEASQLVLQAATLGKGGEVFVLDMGEPVKIVDLARDLIRLSGLQPDQDIEIRFSGTRPGEKLFEELTTDEEQADKTTHRKIFVGRVREVELESLKFSLSQLEKSMLSPDPAAIYAALRELIPEFSGERTEESVARLKAVE
jgi:FlaA1/EpsC-like NDP-sugar epimerase